MRSRAERRRHAPRGRTSKSGACRRRSTRSGGPSTARRFPRRPPSARSRFFRILALIDATELNRFGAQWKTRVELGTNLALDSRFYQPLGYASDAFVSPRLLISQTPVDIFESSNTQRIAEYRVRRSGVGLDLGYDFGSIAEIRGGVQFGSLKAVLRTGLPQFPEVDVNSGAFVAELRVDQLDNASLPKNGYFANLDWRGERDSLGAESNYDRLEASALGSVTF